MTPRPPQPITTTSEGGGVVLTCACGWVQFTSVGLVDGARRMHEKKCAVARREEP